MALDLLASLFARVDAWPKAFTSLLASLSKGHQKYLKVGKPLLADIHQLTFLMLLKKDVFQPETMLGGIEFIVRNHLTFCSEANVDVESFMFLVFSLYRMLFQPSPQVRKAAMKMFSLLLKQRLDVLGDLLVQKVSKVQTFNLLDGGFDKLIGSDFDDFELWFGLNFQAVSWLFEQRLQKCWLSLFSKHVASHMQLLSRDRQKLIEHTNFSAIELRDIRALFKRTTETSATRIKNSEDGQILRALQRRQLMSDRRFAARKTLDSQFMEMVHTQSLLFSSHSIVGRQPPQGVVLRQPWKLELSESRSRVRAKLTRPLFFDKDEPLLQLPEKLLEAAANSEEREGDQPLLVEGGRWTAHRRGPV